MSEGETTLFTLKDRIAALNKSQSEREYLPPKCSVGNRPTPPPLPSTRPRPKACSKGSNDPPPLSTVSTRLTLQKDLPMTITTREILAPPPLDRVLVIPPSSRPRPPCVSKSLPPALPRRNIACQELSESTASLAVSRIPPPLPSRLSFEAPTDDRRVSSSSSMSERSTTSTALTSGASSTTSYETNHVKVIRAPMYDPASLPKLPPSRKELAAIAQQEKEDRIWRRRQSRELVR